MSTALQSTSQTTTSTHPSTQLKDLHSEFLKLTATLDSLRSVMAYPSQPGTTPSTAAATSGFAGVGYSHGTLHPSSLVSGGGTPSSSAAMAAAAAAGVPSTAGFSMPNVPPLSSFPISSGLFSTPLAMAPGPSGTPATPGHGLTTSTQSGFGSAKGTAISPLLQTPMVDRHHSLTSGTGLSAGSISADPSIVSAKSDLPSVSGPTTTTTTATTSTTTGTTSTGATISPATATHTTGTGSLSSGQVFAPMMHPVFGPVLAPLPDGGASSSGTAAMLSKSSSMPTAMGWPASSSSLPMDGFHSAPFFSVGSSVGSSILSSVGGAGGLGSAGLPPSSSTMAGTSGISAGSMYGSAGLMTAPSSIGSGLSSMSAHSPAAYVSHPGGSHLGSQVGHHHHHSMAAQQRRITGITSMGGGIQPVMYQTSLEEQMRAYDRRTAETIRAKQQQRQQRRQQQQQQQQQQQHPHHHHHLHQHHHGAYHGHHSSFKSEGFSSMHGSGATSVAMNARFQQTRGDKLALLQRMTEGPRIRIDTSILRSANVRLPDIVTENKIFLKMVSNKFGSKYIQRLADDPLTPLEHIDMLVTALEPHALEIGQNVFGNYVLQKMLELTVERVCYLETQQSRLMGASTAAAMAALSRGVGVGGSVTPSAVSSAPGMGVGGTTPSKKNLDMLRQMGNKLMMSIVKDNTVELSRDQFGCRVLQRILKYNHDNHKDIFQAKKQILSEVTSNDETMQVLIMDEFGNHVIQKCIENIPSEELLNLTDNISKQCLEYSCHVYGCRVVQRVLTNCSPTQTSGIFAAVLTNVHVLCGDEYGNYVVQHSVNCAHDLSWLSQMTGYLARFSASLVSQKYSANVIEKVIPMLSADLRAKIFDGILSKRVPLSSPEVSSSAVAMTAQESTTLRMSDTSLIVGTEKEGDSGILTTDEDQKQGEASPKKPPLSMKSLSVSLEGVMDGSEDSVEKTVTLVSDMVYSAFGNYVVQSMLDNCNQEYYEKICMEIARDLNYERLKGLQWGKFVLQKMGHTTRSK